MVVVGWGGRGEEDGKRMSGEGEEEVVVGAIVVMVAIKNSSCSFSCSF